MQKNPATAIIHVSNDDPTGADAPRGSAVEREISLGNFAGISPPAASINSPQDCNQREVATGASAPAKVTTPPRKLRRSCDFCTKRKRKCDGDGVNRCSLCASRNQPDCHYSIRLPTGPRPHNSPLWSSNSSSSSSSSIIIANDVPHTSSTRKCDHNAEAFLGGQRLPSSRGDMTKSTPGRSAGAQRHQSFGTMARGVAYHGSNTTAVQGVAGNPRYAPLMPLKRARLSPSPATGLIGLKENVYIGDFFQTLGFLPFTDESDIRKAMIATVFGTMERHVEGGNGSNRGLSNQEDGANDGEEVGWRGREDTIVSSLSSSEIGAEACVLWCTVALGYLVQGRPLESVVCYINLATEALATCFEIGGVGPARAFTLMAFVQNFMGDEVKFRKYLDFAKSSLAGLPPEAVPTELKEAIMYMRATETFWMNPSLFDEKYSELREECAELSEGTSQFPDSIETPNIFRRNDLCRWLMKLNVGLAYCFHKDMLRKGVNEDIDPHPSLYDHPDRPDGGSRVWIEERGWGRNCMEPNVVLGDNPSSSWPSMGQMLLEGEARTEEPPLPGEMSRRFAANAMREFNTFEHIASIDDIRNSLGELYYRSIMAYVAKVEGHVEYAGKNLMRCADVIVQHPGLCRLNSWRHLTHCILAALAVRGIRNEYSKLREVYNAMISHPKVPPLEEWSGMKVICDTFFCRSLTSVRTPDTNGQSSIHVYPPVKNDYVGGEAPTSPPPPQLDLLSPETTIKDIPRQSAREQQMTVHLDGTPSSEGKESYSNGAGCLASAIEGVTAAINSRRAPRVEERRDWVELSPKGLERGLEFDKSAGAVGGGSKEGGICNGHSGGGGGYDNASAPNGGCGFPEVHAEQVMPIPLDIEGRYGLEWLDSASMVSTLDAFLTQADLEAFACDEEANCGSVK